MGKKVDYLIRGGRVLDPYRGLDAVCDIAVKDGIIVSSEDVDAAEEINAEGCIVTPGLIDFHCHVCSAISDLPAAPEILCFPTGVTTAVDAGSSGTRKLRSIPFSHIQQPRPDPCLSECMPGRTGNKSISRKPGSGLLPEEYDLTISEKV